MIFYHCCLTRIILSMWLLGGEQCDSLLTVVCLSSSRAREALRQCLPDQLKDTTFAQVLKDDTTTKRWLAQLVKNLQEGQVTDPRGIPLPPQ